MTWAQIVSDFNAQPNARPRPARAQSKTHKRCVQCDKNLPVTEFYARSLNQYTSRCKPCYLKKQKEWGIR